MSNIHGLFSGRNNDDDDSDDENNRFVGGIGERGGGSGLAVRPNPESIFSRAEDATADDEGQVQRTITMYRDGFVVDDGPYRRLDDPSNGDFLRSLAMGRTPTELAGDGDVVVGLIDKRHEEYVETFQSFSGEGNSLGGTANASTDGAFDPASLPESPPPVDDHKPVTSIQMRLPNGTRRVVRINLSMTVGDLAAHLRSDAGSEPFRLVAGFPPKPLTDASATVEGAGLKGAQVSLQKVN